MTTQKTTTNAATAPIEAVEKREDWFATSVWYFDFANPDSMNESLLAKIRSERAVDPAGMSDRSSILGWHSKDDLQHRDSFQPIIRKIEHCVAKVVAFQDWDLEQVTPRITNCWANENDRHSSNGLHNHPRSALSGVYYVKAPENCGDLFFRDPREGPSMVEPPIKNRTPWTFRKVIYKPQVGRLLIFPSWLLHGVEPNLSDESLDDPSRVCISFNVGYMWN